jgi:lysophospholipase L1-like esterase
MIVAIVMRIAAIVIGVLLLPVVALQIWLVKRQFVMPKYPEGESSGQIDGVAPETPILLIGESTIRGLGVSQMADALPQQLAAGLELYSRRAIRWDSDGVAGLKITQARKRFAGKAFDKYSIVIIALGVNDVLGLTCLPTTARAINGINQAILQKNGDAQIFWCGVPPVEKFPALRFPLSLVMGLWAKSLDAQIRHLSRIHQNIHHLSTPSIKARHFSIDGVHPGRLAYQQWGEYLGRNISNILQLRVKGVD